MSYGDKLGKPYDNGSGYGNPYQMREVIHEETARRMPKNYELNLRENIEDIKNPCDGAVYKRKDGTQGMVISCPKCGHVATGNHILEITESGKQKFYTLTPSLVMSGCCGWHGWLTNNIFIEA